MTTIVNLWPGTGLSKHGDPMFPHFCPCTRTGPVLGHGGARDALERAPPPPPPPSRAPSLCPATVPLTPSASLNVIVTDRDTTNATPQTQSEGDNALNPVEAARLLPHPGTRDGTNCKALSA